MAGSRQIIFEHIKKQVLDSAERATKTLAVDAAQYSKDTAGWIDRTGDARGSIEAKDTEREGMLLRHLLALKG